MTASSCSITILQKRTITNTNREIEKDKAIENKTKQANRWDIQPEED